MAFLSANRHFNGNFAVHIRKAYTKLMLCKFVICLISTLNQTFIQHYFFPCSYRWVFLCSSCKQIYLKLIQTGWWKWASSSLRLLQQFEIRQCLFSLITLILTHDETSNEGKSISIREQDFLCNFFMSNCFHRLLLQMLVASVLSTSNVKL